MAFGTGFRLAVLGGVAWLAPAAIAGALGWRGVWGSGSAFVDYLIPIPVAGGALHVPSFVLLLVTAAQAPHVSARVAGWARSLSLGAALTALVLLLPPPDWRPSQNPLGLFVLCDALVALLALVDAPREPGLRLDAGRLAAFAAVPALGGLVAWNVLGLGEEFRLGMATQSADFVVSSIPVVVRGDPASPKVRQRAQAWAETHQHPRQWMNVEVASIRFAPHDRGTPALLCLYEDGTPARWLSDGGDCLAGFTTFASRLSRHAAAVPADAPRELREYLAARAACEEIGWRPKGQDFSYMVATDAACRDLERRRELLLPRFPQLR